MLIGTKASAASEQSARYVSGSDERVANFVFILRGCYLVQPHATYGHQPVLCSMWDSMGHARCPRRERIFCYDGT